MTCTRISLYFKQHLYPYFIVYTVFLTVVLQVWSIGLHIFKLFVKEVWKESVLKDHWPSMKIAKRERTEGLAVIALSMLGCKAKPLSQIGRQALDMPLDVEFP